MNRYELPNIENLPEWLEDDGCLDIELTAEIELAASEKISDSEKRVFVKCL